MNSLKTLIRTRGARLTLHVHLVKGEEAHVGPLGYDPEF